MSVTNRELIETALAGAVLAPAEHIQTGQDPVRQYLAEIGRRGGLIGGRARSKRKAATSRANGFKGGRPRKVSKLDAEPKT